MPAKGRAQGGLTARWALSRRNKLKCSGDDCESVRLGSVRLRHFQLCYTLSHRGMNVNVRTKEIIPHATI
jgi:hypothetical protein